MASVSYVSSHYSERKAFYIGETGMREALLAGGFTIVNDTDELADFVFIGLNREADYSLYSKAVKHLVNGAVLVGTNNDRILLSEKGVNVGNGSVVAMFEYLCGRESIKIGKPHQPILDEALKFMNVSKKDVIVVGDNLETDIALGERFGVETIFVLTGIHKKEDIERLNIHPTYVVERMTDWKG